MAYLPTVPLIKQALCAFSYFTSIPVDKNCCLQSSACLFSYGGSKKYIYTLPYVNYQLPHNPHPLPTISFTHIIHAFCKLETYKEDCLQDFPYQLLIDIFSLFLVIYVKEVKIYIHIGVNTNNNKNLTFENTLILKQSREIIYCDQTENSTANN